MELLQLLQVGNFLRGQLGLYRSRVTLGMSQHRETLGINQPQHLPAETGAAAGRRALRTGTGIPGTSEKPKIPPAGIRVQLQTVGKSCGLRPARESALVARFECLNSC